MLIKNVVLALIDLFKQEVRRGLQKRILSRLNSELKKKSEQSCENCPFSKMLNWKEFSRTVRTV